MVRYCLLCNKKNVENPDLTFHKFPSDSELRKSWLNILNIPDTNISAYTNICSSHFSPDNFSRKPKTRVKFLKKDAMPMPYIQTFLSSIKEENNKDSEILEESAATVKHPKIENGTPEDNLNISTEQMDQTCRACLEMGQVFNLFETIYDDVPLNVLYTNISSIQVNKNDGLSNNICTKCLNILIHFHQFTKKAKESYDILKELTYTSKENSKYYTDMEIVDCEIQDVKKFEIIVNNDYNEPQPLLNVTLDKKNSEILLKEGNYLGIKEEDPFCEVEFNQSSSSNILSTITNSSAKNPKTSRKKSTAILKKTIKKSNVIRKAKPKLEFFVCYYCKATFNSNVEYKLHVREERILQRKNKTCNICQKRFSTTGLTRHMRTHTKEKPYNCQLCSSKFSLSENLDRHMRIHTGDRPYDCKTCGKSFTRSLSLQEHLRSHTGEKPFMCSNCGQQFSTSFAFKAHMQSYEEAKVGVEVKNIPCDRCDKLFATKLNLAKHRQIHSEKRFLCSECGKKFSSNGMLQTHLKTHAGIRPYACDICNKSFSQRTSLHIHKLIHTGEKPFVCQICNKRFTQTGHLTCHMRVHNNERPYHCMYCTKSFGYSNILKVHIRTHTGETPFFCDICSKGFYDSSSMKKHRRRHIDKFENKK